VVATTIPYWFDGLGPGGAGGAALSHGHREQGALSGAGSASGNASVHIEHKYLLLFNVTTY
jgi:hypothetical protein